MPTSISLTNVLGFHSNGIELRDIVMNDEAIIQLTNDHIHYLAEEGFLSYIMSNKQFKQHMNVNV